LMGLCTKYLGRKFEIEEFGPIPLIGRRPMHY
jgi:hypothetical protein